MEVNTNLLKLMGEILDKKDGRTIDKLASTHPKLYALFEHIGEERMGRFLAQGNLGEIDPLLKEDDAKIREMRLQGDRINGDLLKETSRLRKHASFLMQSKMKGFFNKKAGGNGLRVILENAVSPLVATDEVMLNPKLSIVASIEAYETSITRGEVANHKQIVIDFIKVNVSDYECELLLEEYRKELNV